MALTVERYAGDAAEWDAFAASRPGYTHFHRFAWQRVVREVFGHECVYLAARAPGGSLEGVLPLIRVKSLLFGHYLVSMPFLNYGGPLGDEDAVRALTASAVDIARRDRVKLLELRSRIPLSAELPVSHRKITVVRDLPSTPEALFRSFDSKLRAQIRRPQKENVSVLFGPDQVEPFFDVFARHMRELGTPTQPRRLFETIAREFGDDVWFACAYVGGRPIAGGCGFRWGREFEMTWASSLRAFNRISPNMLLYWSFMERCVREGLATFNFGRCSPGGGTHRFKLQWGSRDEPLWWYQHAAIAGSGSTPSPDDGAYSWGPRIWKKLPTSIATAIGPRIVRYIP